MSKTTKNPIVIEAKREKTTGEPSNQNKKRVCAYCRVSSQSEEQENSFDAQVTHYNEYIQSKSEWEFLGIYSDEGISGTSTSKRVGFRQMLFDASNKKFDMIICKSISRFGRNTTDILSSVRQLKDLDIAVYFENENINTLESAGEIFLTIFASLAQDGSRQISESVQWGNDKAFKKAKVYGNQNILGYNIIKGSLIIDEEQAKTVKKIFGLYLEGYGVVRIAKYLEANEHKTALNKEKWHPTSILNILKNEKYAGTLLTQKYFTTDYLSHRKLSNNGEVKQYLFEDNHEAIISKEVFSNVQLELEKRAKMQQSENGRRTKHSNKYPLSGKLKCQNCGEGFRRTIWHKGKTYENVVWQCIGYSLKGKDYCSTGAIPQKIIYEAMKLIVKDMQDDQTFEESLNRVINALNKMLKNTSHEPEIASIQSQINNLNAESKELRKMLMKKQITEDEFEEDREEIKNQIIKLNAALSELQETQNNFGTKIKGLETFRGILKKKLDDEMTTYSIEDCIEQIVENITIKDKNNFKVYITNDISYICSNTGTHLNISSPLERI
ncbi:recombinase family protein [Clostridium sp. FP2]|uniref:recombinase family protein n=1 Tax=Clostridium sp. FP2 TaxID=2724481 RepID=UPI0013E97139|nr:recombinase family protein [Clostridium sp. FP2]MBZ9622818.1 recombinase family protein [Clostridium sp. FP2]